MNLTLADTMLGSDNGRNSGWLCTVILRTSRRRMPRGEIVDAFVDLPAKKLQRPSATRAVKRVHDRQGRVHPRTTAISLHSFLYGTSRPHAPRPLLTALPPPLSLRAVSASSSINRSSCWVAEISSTDLPMTPHTSLLACMSYFYRCTSPSCLVGACYACLCSHRELGQAFPTRVAIYLLPSDYIANSRAYCAPFQCDLFSA